MNDTEKEILKSNALAMLAHANGEAVELSCPDGDRPEWLISSNPLWKFDDFCYRPAPNPVTRLWSKPEDVPGPICWIRDQGQDGFGALVIGIDPSGVEALFYEQKPTLVKWRCLRLREYSTDRKTWHPCTITEAAQ